MKHKNYSEGFKSFPYDRGLRYNFQCLMDEEWLKKEEEKEKRIAGLI